MIEAAIFDMDGLIVDSEPLWWEAEIQVFAGVSVRLTEKQCRETTGLRVDQIVEYWYRRFPWQGLTQEQVKEQLVEKVIELINLKCQPKEGLEHALDFFKSKDIKIALASSSMYSIINAVVTKLKLHEMFQVLYSAEDEIYSKPHPGIYITTAHRLGVAVTQCVALEDSLNGVLSAKSARMKCIAIPENFPSYNPKFVIADLVLGSLLAIQEKNWVALNDSY